MKKELVFLTLFLVIFGFRFNATKPKYNDGDKIRISSSVYQEPIKYDYSQQIKLYDLKIYLPLFPEINYGDEIIVEGIVQDKELINPKLINYKKPQNILLGFRQKLLSFYNKNLPKDHFALVSGVVLGSKQGIGKQFWQILRNSGTAHVVVASGMNVTLVAGFLLSLFLVLFSRKKAVTFSIIGIWVYSFMAGMEAPIVRAAIMGSIAFGAMGIGRMSDSWRALIISALVMLLIKPVWIKDLGFILSFSATLGLMLFESKINRLILFIPSIFREGLSTSLAAQIFVAPIIFIAFSQFNLFSPLINALVLWTIGPITVMGMIAGIMGVAIPMIGKALLYLIYPLTSWFIFIIQIFEK